MDNSDNVFKIGSNIMVTVGTKQVDGCILKIYNYGREDGIYNSGDTSDPYVYWDIEYEIFNPSPGRGNIGHWKQNVDGGYLQLA